MKRLAIIVGLACLTLFGLATPAFAHNSLIASNPADEATVEAGPASVELTFDQPVQKGEGLNSVTVAGPESTNWETGPVEVTGNVVTAPLGELGPAGDYRIAYRIVSADGHPVTGDLAFKLTNAGDGEPIAASANIGGEAAGDSSGGGGLPIWVWIAGAVVLLGAGLGVALRIGGKQPR
ncbi:MAG TPA: copper resistance CopC family protein [Actinophytocola sp.]|nr:copper resistance CopC family protein [Actinophytocola sp.]